MVVRVGWKSTVMLGCIFVILTLFSPSFSQEYNQDYEIVYLDNNVNVNVRDMSSDGLCMALRQDVSNMATDQTTVSVNGEVISGRLISVDSDLFQDVTVEFCIGSEPINMKFVGRGFVKLLGISDYTMPFTGHVTFESAKHSAGDTLSKVFLSNFIFTEKVVFNCIYDVKTTGVVFSSGSLNQHDGCPELETLSLLKNEETNFADYEQECHFVESRNIGVTVKEACPSVVIDSSKLFSIMIGDDGSNMNPNYVQVNHTQVSQSSYIYSSGSGQVNISESEFLGELKIVTVDADVLIKKTVLANLYITTYSGNIEFEYLSIPFSTLFGSIVSEFGVVVDVSLNLETQLRYTEPPSNKKSHFMIEGIGDETNQIKVRTEYGNVNATMKGVSTISTIETPVNGTFKIEDFDHVYVETPTHFNSFEMKLGIEGVKLKDDVMYLVGMIVDIYNEMSPESLVQRTLVSSSAVDKTQKTMKCVASGEATEVLSFPVHSLCLAYVLIPDKMEFGAEEKSGGGSLILGSKNIHMYTASTTLISSVEMTNVINCVVDGVVVNDMNITSATEHFFNTGAEVSIDNALIYNKFNYNVRQTNTYLTAHFISSTINPRFQANVDSGIFVNKVTTEISYTDAEIINVDGGDVIHYSYNIKRHDDLTTLLYFTKDKANNVLVAFDGSAPSRRFTRDKPNDLLSVEGDINFSLVSAQSWKNRSITTIGGKVIVYVNTNERLGTIDVRGDVHSHFINAHKIKCESLKVDVFDVDVIDVIDLVGRWNGSAKLSLVCDKLSFHFKEISIGFLEPAFGYQYSSYYNQTSITVDTPPNYIPELRRDIESITLNAPYELGKGENPSLVVAKTALIGVDKKQDNSEGPIERFPVYELNNSFGVLLSDTTGDAVVVCLIVLVLLVSFVVELTDICMAKNKKL